MKFTVAWAPVAERKLTDLWLAAPDREAVASASDLIDQQLRERPHLVGESRGAGQRLLIESPLAVLYEVQMGDRYAFVRAVWRCD